MADANVAAPTAAAPASSPSSGKKAAGQKKGKGGAQRAKPSHPRTSEMVNNAIKSLKERGGSSLQAIKKYVSANYKVDAEKLSPFIKKYLKSAVASGALLQPKGKGASGSFKLAVAGSGKQADKGSAPAPKAAASKAAKKSPKKAKAAGGVKKPKAKKAAGEKKQPAKGRKSAATGAAAGAATPSAAAEKKAAKPKTPSKAKKTTKVPTKKPKAPKPKKAKPAGKAAAKKASPKKK